MKALQPLEGLPSRAGCPGEQAQIHAIAVSRARLVDLYCHLFTCTAGQELLARQQFMRRRCTTIQPGLARNSVDHGLYCVPSGNFFFSIREDKRGLTINDFAMSIEVEDYAAVADRDLLDKGRQTTLELASGCIYAPDTWKVDFVQHVIERICIRHRVVQRLSGVCIVAD